VPVMGSDGSDFTTGYIEAGVTPHFKLLQDDKLINLEGDIPVFENNGLYMVALGVGCADEYNIGDVNGDGDINTLDLVQIVNYILDLSIPDYECAADYNQDGSVDILDLVAIVNIILFDE